MLCYEVGIFFYRGKLFDRGQWGLTIDLILIYIILFSFFTVYGINKPQVMLE